VKFLAQTISEINTKQEVLKLMMGALRPSFSHTAQHGVVIVRTETYQPEAKRQTWSKQRRAMVK